MYGLTSKLQSYTSAPYCKMGRIHQGDVLRPHINTYLQRGEISDMCCVRTNILHAHDNLMEPNLDKES